MTRRLLDDDLLTIPSSQTHIHANLSHINTLLTNIPVYHINVRLSYIPDCESLARHGALAELRFVTCEQAAPGAKGGGGMGVGKIIGVAALGTTAYALFRAQEEGSDLRKWYDAQAAGEDGKDICQYYEEVLPIAGPFHHVHTPLL
jgi:hypothetical protein